MSWWSYLLYKLFAMVFRALVRLQYRGLPTVPPDEVYQIPSRDTGRTIKAHVYRSSSASSTSATKPAPVLINLHGSGFLIPLHGSDGPFCRQISQQTAYTVLDVQYRLSPEHPFPAALHDVEDVVNWVLRPNNDDGNYHFDPSRIALSGFSAGANLALAVASASAAIPQHAIHCVIAFYPPLDLYTPPSAKSAPDPTGKPIPPAIAWLFDRCYIPAGVDARDPRISPHYSSEPAQLERFPDRLLLITAARDGLALEAEALAARLRQLPPSSSSSSSSSRPRDLVCERMHACDHGWDKSAKPGSIQADARDKAYAMAVAMLSRS